MYWTSWIAALALFTIAYAIPWAWDYSKSLAAEIPVETAKHWPNTPKEYKQ